MFDYQTSTHKFIPHTTDEDGNVLDYTCETKVIENRLSEYFAKYPLLYKQVTKKLKEDSSETSIALYMCGKNHDRAKQLLFNILSRHMERWWN